MHISKIVQFRPLNAKSRAVLTCELRHLFRPLTSLPPLRRPESATLTGADFLLIRCPNCHCRSRAKSLGRQQKRLARVSGVSTASHTDPIRIHIISMREYLSYLCASESEKNGTDQGYRSQRVHQIKRAVLQRQSSLLMSPLMS